MVYSVAVLFLSIFVLFVCDRNDRYMKSCTRLWRCTEGCVVHHRVHSVLQAKRCFRTRLSCLVQTAPPPSPLMRAKHIQTSPDSPCTHAHRMPMNYMTDNSAYRAKGGANTSNEARQRKKQPPFTQPQDGNRRDLTQSTQTKEKH